MIGEAIGNFRVVSCVGRGGMGEVYLAEQQNIGTKVAVKLLRPEISVDAEHVQRFFNEARAVSRIQHAGIVKIFDVGVHASGQAYLVMEYLEGESLARRLRRTGPLPAATVAEVGRQIASVLDATHSAGITHRDLKPDNIYLIRDRELESGVRVKVLDFGIAKLSGTLAASSPQTVGTMGTPAYMAPEQWGDASKVDSRADMYSLGCVVFEMLVGRPPFVVTTLAEACGKHLTAAPPRLAAVAPDAPPELDALVDELLAKRADDRPPSMNAVAQRFAALSERIGLPPITEVPITADSSAAFGATVPPPQLSALGTAPPAGLGATVGTAPPASARSAPSPPPPVPRGSRRGLAIVAGMVAVAGASVALTAVLMKGGGAPASGAAACALPLPEPTLVGTSSETVSLRYQFQANEQTAYTLVRQTRAEHRDESGVQTSEMSLRMHGKLSWYTPSNATFRGQFSFHEVNLDRVGEHAQSGQPTTYDAVHLRSNDPDAPPSITTVKGYTTSVAVDAQGRQSTDHFKHVRDALATTPTAAEVLAMMDRAEFTRIIFLELPDEPVKIGDRWKAGELLGEWQDVGTLVAPFELAVAGISADRRYVLVRAEPALALHVTGQVAIDRKATRLRLWALFDRERGEIAASALAACADVELRRDDTRLEAHVELRTSFESRLLEPGTPAP